MWLRVIRMRNEGRGRNSYSKAFLYKISSCSHLPLRFLSFRSQGVDWAKKVADVCVARIPKEEEEEEETESRSKTLFLASILLLFSVRKRKRKRKRDEKVFMKGKTVCAWWETKHETEKQWLFCLFSCFPWDAGRKKSRSMGVDET